jgi:hypothetical protein
VSIVYSCAFLVQRCVLHCVALTGGCGEFDACTNEAHSNDMCAVSTRCSDDLEYIV